MSEGPRHLRYWAKTVPGGAVAYHPVLYHCLDVAAVGRALLEARPRALERLAAASGLPASTLLSFLPLLLSFHDLGKLADGFQCQVPDLMRELQDGAFREGRYDRELFRHDSMGFAALETRLDQDLSWLAPEMFSSSVVLWLSAAMGHHGRPPIVDGSQRADLRRQFPPEVAADLATTLETLRQLFLPGGLGPQIPDVAAFEEGAPKASWLFAGLAVEADWLGSNPRYFPPNIQDLTARQYFEDIALPAARKAVADAGLREKPLAVAKSFAELWPAYQPTPLQELAASLPLATGPQLIVIEEVTGGGKTEAALTLVHRLLTAGLGDGLYFGLPTMATANAMYGRLTPFGQEFFAEGAEPSLVLAHGRSQLHLEQLAEALRGDASPDGESALAQCASWIADGRKKALLAELGVGTIDQALLAVLQTRHQSLRLWGLAGKVLVVDEVHAADAYMQKLLCGLLEAHAAFGSSAILLSATLPVEQRYRLLAAFAKGTGYRSVTMPEPDQRAYPALVHLVDGQADVHPIAARAAASRTITVRLLHEEEAVDQVLEQTLAAGGCACWVRNTVRDAIEAYRRWSARLGADRVELFHARFTVADRHRIERAVLQRFGKNGDPAGRTGRLLIATQVVEQSLDLDFDLLVSDLAPIDLLVQRAGRLRRHARNLAGARLEEGPDQRGEAIFYVFSPPDSPEVPANWVSSILPGTARVYEDHGRLWRSARWLRDRGCLQVPEDLREMIEAVYSQNSAMEMPPALATLSDKVDGKSKADRSIADTNRIRFHQGYEPDGSMSSWRDDVNTPTRLSEPTVTLRLGVLRGGAVQPLHPGPHGWQLSEISVRQALVASAQQPEHVVPELPAFEKQKVLVVLESTASGFEGTADTVEGVTYFLTYADHCGLEVQQRA